MGAKRPCKQNIHKYIQYTYNTYICMQYTIYMYVYTCICMSVHTSSQCIKQRKCTYVNEWTIPNRNTRELAGEEWVEFVTLFLSRMMLTWNFSEKY